jgi:quercetin dioxygenase-like cupin family protein
LLLISQFLFVGDGQDLVVGIDEPKRIYRAGESWYETPGARHAVSRNASATEPAKLLAVFVVDTDDKILTIPDK